MKNGLGKSSPISNLIHLEEIASTQTFASQIANDGAENRTLVWADRQTAGRGRLSRTWDSALGGLYFSWIFRPSWAPERLAELSLKTAGEIARTIAQKTGLKTLVKPPNDVLALQTGRGTPTKKTARKICGILAEAKGGASNVDWLVVGIGLNVNNAPQAPRASSLKILTGRPWDERLILESLLDSLGKLYSAEFGL